MMSATPTTFWPAWCRRAGLETIQVFSGAEALEAVAKQPPDLILLDLMLEDIDGFELCDRLKRDRRTNLIPIVMVTGASRCAPPGSRRAGRCQRLFDQAVHASEAV